MKNYTRLTTKEVGERKKKKAFKKGSKIYGGYIKFAHCHIWQLLWLLSDLIAAFAFSTYGVDFPPTMSYELIVDSFQN